MNRYDYITSYFDKDQLVDLLNLKPEHINIRHVLTTLLFIHRYNGNSRNEYFSSEILDNFTYPWSVLEHSILCDNIAILLNLPIHIRKPVFIHDFHEGLMGDITSPVIKAIHNIADTPIDPVRHLQDYLQNAFDKAVGYVYPEAEVDKNQIRKIIKMVDFSAALLEMYHFWPKIRTDKIEKLYNRLKPALALKNYQDGQPEQIHSNNFLVNKVRHDIILKVATNRFEDIFPGILMHQKFIRDNLANDAHHNALWAKETRSMDMAADKILSDIEKLSDMNIENKEMAP